MSTQNPAATPALLEGQWTQASIDDITTYTRTTPSEEAGPWIKFALDGSLQVRQNSGWCGTPPISYATYSGTYTISEDNTLQLKHGFWGGTITTRFEIVAVSEAELQLRYIDSSTDRKDD